MKRVLIFYSDANYTKRHKFQEVTPCSLLLLLLGVASGGDLTEVAYGVAQSTKEGQTVHSMPVTGVHISVTVETIVKGFEDFSLPVPAFKIGHLLLSLMLGVKTAALWLKNRNK